MHCFQFTVTIVELTKIMGDEEYRIFVGGLSFKAMDDDLYDVFDKYGTVKDVRIITDRDTGRPRGFAFVEYSNRDDMEDVIKGADGKEILGREIKCYKANPRGERGGGPGRGGGGGAGRRRSRSRSRERGGGSSRDGGGRGGGGRRRSRSRSKSRSRSRDRRARR